MIAHAELIALGFTTSGVQRRLAAGRAHRLHAGVYAWGHRRVPFRGHLWAAVLACGEGALISHVSAAALLDLRADERVIVDGLAAPLVEITVSTTRTSSPGLAVHFARRLALEDRAAAFGIPVTAPMRTLLDLSRTLDRDRDLERCVERAHRADLLDPTAFERWGPRSGTKRLKRILGAGRRFTRSESERRMIRLLGAHMLPDALVNSRRHGLEVDFLWPTHRLVVELDGDDWHSTKTQIQSDHERDRHLRAQGDRVERVTVDELWLTPEKTAALIAAWLRATRSI